MNSKVLIFAAVAFVAGLGGGTGVVVMRAPVIAPVDTTATVRGTPALDTVGTHAVSEAKPQVAEPAHVAVASSAPPDAPPSIAPAVQPVVIAPVPTRVTQPAPEFTQVAKIMTNMKATDAAKLFAYLPDEQTEGILRAMGARQAATLLAELPSERAARLSQRLLRPVSARTQ